MLLAGQVGGANTVPLITPPHVGGWGGGERGRGEADWTSDSYSVSHNYVFCLYFWRCGKNGSQPSRVKIARVFSFILYFLLMLLHILNVNMYLCKFVQIQVHLLRNN